MFCKDVDPARRRCGYGFIKGQGLCILYSWPCLERLCFCIEIAVNQALEAMTAPTVKNRQTQGPCLDSLEPTQ